MSTYLVLQISNKKHNNNNNTTSTTMTTQQHEQQTPDQQIGMTAKMSTNKIIMIQQEKQ